MEEKRINPPGGGWAGNDVDADNTASERKDTLQLPNILSHVAASASSPVGNAALTPVQPAATVLETSEAEGNLLRTTEGAYSTSSLEALRRESTNSSISSADYFSTNPAGILPSTSDSQNTSAVPALSLDLRQHRVDDARPGVHRTASHNVVDEHPLADQSHRDTAVRPPKRSQTDHPRHPEYPEQSLAALHTQVKYYHSSHFERDTQAHTQRLWQRPPPPDSPLLEPRKLTLNTTRPAAASTTPAHTPGLYASAVSARPPASEGFDDHFTMPSPYLHPVQAPPPRTTRSANRDIDYISGRKLINRYEIIDELGRGVQGKVKLARNLETNELVAIKIVQRFLHKRRLGKVDLPEDKLKKEIAILKKARHPNVVRLIEVIDDPDIAKVYIVLEFCQQREIIWRTEGQPHIVLMEYSRQTQEYGSIPPDTSQKNIDRVQRKVALRWAQQDQIRKQAKTARAIDTSALWSLEYATQSDEESGDEASLTSQLTRQDTKISHHHLERIPEDSGLSGSDAEHTPMATTSNPEDLCISTVDSRSPTDITSNPVNFPPAPTSQEAGQKASHPEQEDRTEGFGSYSNAWYNHDDPNPTVAQIDETIRRRRQASVAETSTSGITEIMDNEVPEYYKYVPTMTLTECRSAFRDALVGLGYLHYHGIIHRDIKPENLLRTHEKRVKISDFGVSYLGKPVRGAERLDQQAGLDMDDVNFDTEKGFAKTVGTPAFFAPELCDIGETEDVKPLEKEAVDVWALGVTLFCLVFARVPFDAENEFMLMRRIHTEDIFIPRQRLKAVDPSAPIRSPGHSPLFQKDKRNPQDFDLEPIDDELYDLMKRMYERDPTKRVTLPEIKLHPWVLRGIPDPSSWLDETDPERLGQGQILEPSKEEVADAVIPISIMGRLKSIGKRATSALGLGGSRRRGQSSATSSENGSSTNISEAAERSGRRQSVQVGTQAHVSHKYQSDKELDHPLARSLTTSPEPDGKGGMLDDPPSPTSSPIYLKNPYTEAHPSRPPLPDRHASQMSTAGSIRTIRPSDVIAGGPDVERGRRGSSHSPPSCGDPPQIQQPTPTTPATIGSILTGSARHFIRAAMRSRERFGSGSNSPRQRSGARTPSELDPEQQVFGEATAAVSNTLAPGHTAGHVDFHSHLRDRLSAINDPASPSPRSYSRPNTESPASSGRNSTQPSRRISMMQHDGKSLLSPYSTQPPSPTMTAHQSRRKASSAEHSNDLNRNLEHMPRSTEATEADYRHAKDEMYRRRALEAIQDRELSDASRPSSSFGTKPCPPSPDDDEAAAASTQLGVSTTLSRTHGGHPLNPVSSDDTSSVSHSRSTSFPSVPSAVSADSSVYSDLHHQVHEGGQGKEDSTSSSDDTTDAHGRGDPHPSSAYPSTASVAVSDPGYHGDGDGNGDDNFAVETDDDEDEDSSDEEFLVMSRNKKTPRPENISTGQTLRPKERRDTALRRKESRGTSAIRNPETTRMRTGDGEGETDQDPDDYEPSSSAA